MPLLPGKSEIGHNITEMEKAGHKRSQAVAAALNVARKTRAAGGDVAANSNHAKSDKQKALEGALAAIPGRLPRHDPSAPRSATEAFEQAAEGANAARAEAKAAHERGDIPLKPGQRFHTPKTRDNGEPPYEVQAHYVNPVTGHAGYYVKQHFGDNDPRSRSFPVAAPPERRAEWMPMGGPVAAKADGDVERQARASGGEVSDGAVHTGPIHSIVAGRTDHLPMHVPSGSYVIPADIISAMGEGNTMAGYAHIKRMFSTAPRDSGDDSGSKVPIVAAGGEYVLSPDEVRHAGGGDIDAGHAALDDFVKRYRAKTIKTLSKLPGPVKD